MFFKQAKGNKTANKNKKTISEIYDGLPTSLKSTYHHIILGTSLNDYAESERITYKAVSMRRSRLFKKLNVSVIRGNSNDTRNNITFINHILNTTK